MKILSLLSVTFDTHIDPRDIPAFRGAVIERVGLNHGIFHNHKVDEAGRVHSEYRYPKVQYKVTGQFPSILFIEEGVEEAGHFFTRPDWSLSFGRRRYFANVRELQHQFYPISVTDEPYVYRLRRWMGLNQKNNQLFSNLGSKEQKDLLNRILAGNILGFATGVGHLFERRFDVEIDEILFSSFQDYKGIKARTFDIQFTSNVLLPPKVGLGKGASVGFGVVEWGEKNVRQTTK